MRERETIKREKSSPVLLANTTISQYLDSYISLYKKGIERKVSYGGDAAYAAASSIPIPSGR